ncbi:MAG: dephospho-CoA kinase [Maribacter sp.]
MKIVGLTGGIGSGKSTVAGFFRKLGIPVYNSDERAKKLMNTSKALKEKLIQLFGDIAFDKGQLNRDYISDKVFNDRAVLEKLNAIVHPAVRKHFNKWSKQQDAPYVIQETALLFENKGQDKYDKTILVTSPLALRFERLKARDQSTKAQIEARMKNQLNDAEKIKLADYLIENIDLNETALKVSELHQKILCEP